MLKLIRNALRFFTQSLGQATIFPPFFFLFATTVAGKGYALGGFLIF